MSLTFCGASVRGFSSSIGWNEQSSTMKISVIEDPDNGDFFNPVPVGTPIFFSYGAFRFYGLLQKWVKTNDVGGNPVYEMDCIDPRQLLEGAQIITGGYRGPVTVHNLFNAFGWWENLTGFGSSLSNDAGMPWYKIIQAITVMSNSLEGDYGTALSYRGVRYSLDLSEVPQPPNFYRLPSGTIGLMEAINLLCEDGGCDYFVELNEYTIKVRTVSRLTQPPLGAISALAESGYGSTLTKSSSGLEARLGSETTSAFVIGDQQKTLFFATGDSIQPFWGFDIDGRPILGLGSGVNHTMQLNASVVASIVGGFQYECSVLEMVLALASYESWASYMWKFKPGMAATIGVLGGFGGNNLLIQALRGKDMVRDGKQENIRAALAQTTATNNLHRSKAMYEFVLQYASDYLGKRFLVSIPETLTATEPETLKPIASQEPTDAGYLAEGATPLGLPLLMQDQFKTDDGRFVPFCLFSDLANCDLTRLQGEVAAGPFGLYMKVSVEQGVQGIVFTPNPAVIVTINNPIHELPLSGFGNADYVSRALGVTIPQLNGFQATGAGGNLNVRSRTVPRQPDFIAIPLKSNVLTYGPWFAEGAPGKVRVEIDNSLSPWQYGTYGFMNAAGAAKVTQAVTDTQYVESGTHEEVGPPRWSLGDLLQGNGPNITNIDVNYGPQGITTNYKMTTFTQRYGVFNKDTAKRLERTGRLQAEFRRNFRAATNKALAFQATAGAAYLGWLNNMPAALNKTSPHTVLMAESVSSPDASASGQKRVFVSSMTFDEATNSSGAHDDAIWQQTATMDLNGLFRPFSTNPNNTTMAKYTTPSGNIPGVTRERYDPFLIGNDIDILSSRQSPDALHQGRNPADATDTRALALRGPLVVSGWGWTIDQKYVPGDSNGNPSASGFVENTLKKSHLWKTGPVDLLWDERRGVWTAHDILIGKTSSVIPALGSGTVRIWNGTIDTGWDLTVSNWYQATLASGYRVAVGYTALPNKWYIISADCVAG